MPEYITLKYPICYSKQMASSQGKCSMALKQRVLENRSSHQELSRVILELHVIAK